VREIDITLFDKLSLIDTFSVNVQITSKILLYFERDLPLYPFASSWLNWWGLINLMFFFLLVVICSVV